jgi:DNA polymerase III delta subunit
MQRKGLNGELDAVRFLASEYKEDLPALDKLLDVLMLQLHPRTVVATKDLDATDEGWDTTFMITAIVKGEEHKVLAEMQKALETFHPKGILTVLTRRVNLLMAVAAANVLSGGQPEASEIKPWVWRQNAELVKEIPLKRLAQWAVALDRGYFALSRGSVSMRWVLTQTLLELSRPVA